MSSAAATFLNAVARVERRQRRFQPKRRYSVIGAQRTNVRQNLAFAIRSARRTSSEGLQQYYEGQASVLISWAKSLRAIDRRQFDLLNEFIHTRSCGRKPRV